MIKKLMKYDMKKMFWVLGYIYVICIALAGISRLFLIGKNIQILAIIGAVFQGITYSAIGSIIVNTFVQIIRTFIVTFYKDESYLTHTLPVTKDKLLLSKYLSALIVICSSVIVCFVSLFIMFYSSDFVIGLRALIQTAVTNFNIPTGLFIFLIVVVLAAQICAMISMSFAAIVKANTYNSKRVFKGFIWFVIYYFASMFANLLLIVICFVISGNITSLFATLLPQGAFLTILIVGALAYIACSFIFYFICNKQFKKGVNVD